MAIDRILKKCREYAVLLTLLIIFIVTVSSEADCDYQINPVLPVITLPPHITISPNPAYVGQTITISGSGFYTKPHGSDSYPIAYCNAYCDEHGTLLPIKIQSDGTFVVQPTLKSPGMDDIYAYDNWGNQSNKVSLTVTNSVTFIVKIQDLNGASYTSNGVICIKYPASATFHYENSIIGSTYTTKMAFNGTSAEIWVRQNPLSTDHQAIANIQEGQTYTVSLTMPVNTPTPTASIQPTAQAQTVTPVPSQNPQVTGNPTATLPSTQDTTAPVTTLNLTGVKDVTGAFTSNVVCTLNAADSGGSGVNDTVYSFDAVNWTQYTGPFTISSPGNTTVFYRSTDRAGNQETAGILVVAIAGSVSPTAGASQGAGCCPALLLPLLVAGLAGLYSLKNRHL